MEHRVFPLRAPELVRTLFGRLRVGVVNGRLMALLAATGIGIAALGQALTTRSLPGALFWLTPFADKLEDIYGQAAEPVTAAIILLAVGAALFMLGSRLRPLEERGPLSPPSLGTKTWAVVDYVSAGSLLIGALVFVAAIIALFSREYSHVLAVLLLISLVLMGVGFGRLDFRQGLRLRPRLSSWISLEAVFVLGVLVAFMALNSHDLTSWRYTAWGDEYSQYSFTKAIAQGASFNPFSQDIDGLLPSLNATSQALVMRTMGIDRFSWMFHDVLVAGAALVFFYLLIRELFSVRAAMIGIALLASSHYLYAYVHRPINIDALLPEVAALWLLVLGLRRNSTLALFGAGMVAGLGFYTYYTGRITIVVIAAYMLTFGRKALRPATVLPIGMGFAALVGPLFAVNGWEVIDDMLGQSAVAHAEDVVGPRVTRFAHNVVRSFVGFNYNPDGFHYAWGSLLDPVGAVLYVLGIGLVLSKVRRPGFRLVGVWWAVGLAAAGFTNPYAVTPISRLHYVLPVAVILAALAFEQGLRLLELLPRRRVACLALTSGAFVALMVPVLFLNIHRFWYETPREFGHSREAVAVRAVMSDTCKGHAEGTTLVSASPGSLYARIFDSYDMGDDAPILLRYDDAFTVFKVGGPFRSLMSSLFGLAPGEYEVPSLYPFDPVLPVFVLNGLVRGYVADGCIVAVNDDDRYEEFVNLIRSRYPDKQFSAVTDLGGLHGGVTQID